MFFSKKECPVPFDQQPLNEYLALKKSWLFAWSLSDIKPYLINMVLIFLSLFIFFFLFIYIIVSDFKQTFFYAYIISSLILFLMCIRIYLGWSYIIKRLLSATIFYEESGWYDGQVWVKTSNYLAQDRLIGFYEIIPFITRIKYTCFSNCILFLLIFFIHNIFY
uniref:Ycf36 n=1 Tax=Lophocladia kuetzingii TaxID=675577 RepID=A0A1Z1MP74_9FLOR|nr:hypothetical protein [Lophocladia kuetzingii]ARW67659.1 hypothetical protein [Lophocladia kuetzingii]